MREREHFIGVWLGDEEYVHLAEQCIASGLSVSAFIRQAIAGVQIRPRPPAEYTALLRDLSAIGNNINQIAMVVNSNKAVYGNDIRDLKKQFLL